MDGGESKTEKRDVTQDNSDKVMTPTKKAGQAGIVDSASKLSNGVSEESLSKSGAKQRAHIEPIFVGIAGGTASGKTTVCDEIFDRVRVGEYKECTLIPLDCFYKECTPE